MHRTITTDFLTTVSTKQAFESLRALTIKSLFLRKGLQNDLLKEDLQNIYGKDTQVDLFYNARTALYQYLIAQNQIGKEVIVSGYTCVSVSNAIIQAGYTPIYVDIETETYGIDIEKIEALDSYENIGCIILQHSFGNISRDAQKIISWARGKKILVIEDVAHSFGVGRKDEMTGLLSDAAIFSTGRDKVISSVSGGFILQNKNIVTLNEGKNVPISTVIQNHLYNIIAPFAFLSYGIGKIGQICMLLGQKLHLFPTILSKKEKASKEKRLNYGLPNSLASLMRTQLKELVAYTYARKTHAELYAAELENDWKIIDTYTDGNAFRVVCFCNDESERKRLVNYMKAKGVLLGISWSGKNIAPVGTNLKNAGYTLGTCPISEEVSSKIFFLPASFNHSKKQISYVIELLNNFKR